MSVLRVIKGLVALAVFLFLYLSSLSFAAEVSLVIDGEKKGNISIIVSDGISYIAPEELARYLGGSFKYDPSTGSFSFSLDKKFFQLQLNNPTALVDGKIKLLDYFPRAVGNKIYVPINFILDNTSFRFDSKAGILYVGKLPSVSTGIEKPQPALPGKTEESATISVPSTATAVRVLPAQADASVLLSNVRYYSATNYTRIVLDVSKIPDYNVSVEGSNIIVALKGTRASKEDTYKISDGLVKNVEVVSREESVIIRVSVEGVPIYRYFTLEQPPRLVLDVLRKEQPSTPAITPSPSAKPLLQEEGPRGEPQPKGKGNFLVVIDPGHGGADPGAIGPMGTKEKDVVLNISLYLREELLKKGHRVALTRTGDVYIPLEERSRIANKLKADVFISIHCNASYSASVSGSEIYYMASPSDPSAMAVALRENVELGLTGEEVKKRTDMLMRILEDMMKNAKINESAKLAESIYEAMRGNTDITVKRLAQAPFFVLRGAVMPAVLIEVAFISNPGDEKLLRNSSWQRKVAALIANGIDSYLSSVR